MSYTLTLASWRMTQGIYRIDPSLYASLVDTPITGDIPLEVLKQMPEWCIYIEVHGLSVGSGATCHGVWVRHDLSDSGASMLAIALDVDTEHAGLLPTQHLIFDGGTLEDAIASAKTAWAVATNATLPDKDAIKRVLPWVEPVINLLLYICACNDDIHGKRGQPGNPVPISTRRDGVRLFPADGLKVWDVGVRMGAALRAAYHAAETGQHLGGGSSVRVHIRRAHWHGFRSGKKLADDGTPIPTEKRPFSLKWLPPIAVNLHDIGNLPATIKKVS